ncbi:MAG: autotransporter domain-containing protein [Planctomycetaceae bacterium]|jgi:autotransporter-associated beta strand protein|nr:autotransporter domain-containing protein [Planctomycetaceae bacterium]
MTAMNGIADELLTKKVRRKWQARCGAFILAVIAAWNGAFPDVVRADIITNNVNSPLIVDGASELGRSVDAASKLNTFTWVNNTNPLPGLGNEFIYSTANLNFSTNSTIQIDNGAVLTLRGTESGSTQYRQFTLNSFSIANNGTLQVGYSYGDRVEALIGSVTSVASYHLDNTGNIVVGDSSKLLLYTNIDNTGGGVIRAVANSVLTFGEGSTIIGGTVIGEGNAIININTNRFGSNDQGTYGTELNLSFDGSGKVVFNANTEVYGDITGSGVRLDTGINNVILHGSLTDAQTFEKIGSGRFALAGVGVNAGGVVDKRIKEGTLAFSSVDTLGTGAIRFDGESSKSRTLQLAREDGNALVGEVAIQNLINLSQASGNIDVASDSYGTTQNYSTKAYEVTNPSMLTLSEEKKIIGTFQLTKTGKGLLHIEKSNDDFNGDFAIKDGTVMVESFASLGVNNNTRSVIIDSTTGNSSLVFGNGIGNGSFNRKILLQGNDAGINYGVGSNYNHIGVYASNVVTLTGTISGQSGFIKEGEGTLILSGTNNYVGETVIDNGTVNISSSGALGGSTELTLGWTHIDSSPVLQTQTAASGTTITLSKLLKVNSENAAIDTKDFNANTKNLTVITGNIGSDIDPGTGNSLSGSLHKIGNGTLRFDGNVLSSFTGSLYIGEGTLSVGKSGSLSSSLHFGSDGQDAVGTYYIVNPLDVTRTLNIYETMISAATIYLDVRSGNIIDIDAQKTLTLTGQIRNGVDTTGSPVSGGFTKTGTGTLTLRPTSANTYTGATTFEQGEVIADASDVIASSESLTMGNGTKFSSTGYDQSITNLASSYSNAIVDIGSHTLTLKAKDKSSVFSGNIVGDGTVITKLDSSTLTQSAGFVGFTGKLQLESGTLKLESDATISGISGNSNTFLDVYNKTLTVDIAIDQQYKGAIISSATPNGSGRFIKEGVGTLTTNFVDANGSNKSFGGSIEVRQGNLVIETGDFNMLATNEAELVFYVNDIGAKPAVIDVKGGKAVFGNQLSTMGVLGSGYDGTTLRVDVRDGSGWNLAQGQHTVGEIHAAAGSVYSDYTPDQLQKNLGKGDSVLTPVEVNSLFYSVGKLVDETSQYSNLRVIIDVKGIGGVGYSRNQQQVGANLDAIRVGQTTTGIADIIKGIWETGSNITTEYDARNKRATINGILTALSGDTIANSMYLGLNNHNYRGAFERLNLDAQMYFTPPDAGYYQGQEYRGQVLSNINRIWFNPYTVSTDTRSDGNARSFGTSRQGFLLGYDRRIAQNASAGLLVGYSNPYMYQGEDRVRTSDFTFGAYAGAMIGYYFELKGYVGYGHQQYESTRVVTYSAWDDPRQVADGRFSGDTFALSLELARPLFFGFCIVRPTIGIDSQHVFRGAYGETGDAIAMTVSQADFHQTLGRVGVSAETSTFSRFRLHGQMFFSFQLGGEDYATTTGQYVGIGSVSSQTARSVAVGSCSFDAGIGFDYYLDRSGSFALFGNYNGSSSARMILNDIEIGIKKVF